MPDKYTKSTRSSTDRPAVSSTDKAEESLNDWGRGRGCHKFVPVLGGDGTKIAPPKDLFDQPPGEMS